MTQNMAVTVLLGAISVTLAPLARNSPPDTIRKFLLNIAAIDGLKFECPKPLDENFIETQVVEKEKEREREKENREKMMMRRSSYDLTGGEAATGLMSTLAGVAGVAVAVAAVTGER